MKTLISILAFAFLAFATSAQYRFNQYQTTIATNASYSTNSVTTFNQSFDVGAGTEAWIQIAFKLNNGTNAIPSSATNDFVTVWDTSLDGSRFTNRFTFALKGNASTNEAWGLTNFPVSLPWLRLVNATNTVGATLTNISIRVANQVGL